jgi:hypothetical protein
MGGLSSKPRPFETREGSGTRKRKTIHSTLTYWGGIIHWWDFVKRKMRKTGPPAQVSTFSQQARNICEWLGSQRERQRSSPRP